ncbi:DUF1045 domain-containing protein [Rhizobium beringeri]|uniref:DUF1045 domain-containing protein n=1 Tax=Rhizobium beringeri TaxID=3019934 RepID=A0ABY1XWU2_9HYPH|nr:MULTISPECIES: DUF1045 domain-containing protein [Rhizobium]RWX14270.1 DUF1045 domain-containing protein [Rhizobium leguminosarum]TAU54225.1 DUF1045 domain-containing protein [Rhizobium leguminosarum]TBC74258.1 DUF1045 domain-containing protein [Rhizobium leguminosarum]TBC95495.1 DUF1045 domain-containing protein [Rhizobium leguminosarum]TBE72111.1 DUF1045 domain-containing protein [Rhizobium beringeri]
MRYAICFTPPASDPLSLVAANWLGRNVFSGDMMEPPAVRGLGIHEIAFHTAVPRRYGFHGVLKAPFHLSRDMPESQLLRDLMRFSGTFIPFQIPRIEVARLGNFYSLLPSTPCEQIQYLASAIVQEFDRFRAPLSEAEIERSDPDGLSATQFANLHRWGNPYVMEEFRFHMPVTGPVNAIDMPRIEPVLRTIFEPVLSEPVTVSNVALMIEEGTGGPFRVHSLHPMGKVSARKIA